MTAVADPPEDDVAQDDNDEFDNPELVDGDDLAPAPVEKRERVAKLGSAVAVTLVVVLVGARLFGLGPFGGSKDPATTGGAATNVQVVLPNDVIEAIRAAQQPGQLSSFKNRPSAQDPSACKDLPPATNEALYGLAAGDGTGLCMRVLENGAPPCSLWIGVATTDKGAVFYLSSSGAPLPNQKSAPTKVFWCPGGVPPTTAVPAPTTAPAAAQPGGQ